MWFSSWLETVRARSATRRPRDGQRANRRQTFRRLFLEGLEERRVLALAAPVAYEAGVGVHAVVSADFNNDQVPDLATANYWESTVSILLGNADGTFQPAFTAPTGFAPLSIAVGDLDGDGNFDLAAANAYGVSVLQGNGDGTFDPPSSYEVPYDPSSVAVGDFTGDGKLDLGVTSNYSNYYYGYYYGYQGIASVLVGDGQGNFSAPNSSWLGSGYFADATAANLDGAGADEFLATNSYYGYYYGAVAVLEADLSGFLSLSNTLYTGVDATDVAVDDVNSDGFADVVTADGYYSSVSVLLGDGLGGYSAAQTFAAGSYSFSLALGDFTGDGNVDIAVTDYYAGAVNVLYGAGDGAFSVPIPFAAGSTAWSLASGDFDGNGGLDLAVASFDAGTVSVLLNDQDWGAPPPGLSINDVEVTEGNAGTVAAVFTVTRSGNLDGITTVSYSTANGGAVAGSDYVAVANTVLTFSPGEATKTITILVNGDLTDEYDQGFSVNLSAVSGAVVTDGLGIANILDDDEAPTITITSKVSGKEGPNNKTTSFVFFVTLSGATEKEVRVNFATTDGTATTADNDYVARSGTLVFAPGVTSQSISVLVRGEKKTESNETFSVNLSGATNATIAASQGIGEILDDDAPGGKKKG